MKINLYNWKFKNGNSDKIRKRLVVCMLSWKRRCIAFFNH